MTDKRKKQAKGYFAESSSFHLRWYEKRILISRKALCVPWRWQISQTPCTYLKTLFPSVSNISRVSIRQLRCVLLILLLQALKKILTFRCLNKQLYLSPSLFQELHHKLSVCLWPCSSYWPSTNFLILWARLRTLLGRFQGSCLMWSRNLFGQLSFGSISCWNSIQK